MNTVGSYEYENLSRRTGRHCHDETKTYQEIMTANMRGK